MDPSSRCSIICVSFCVFNRKKKKEGEDGSSVLYLCASKVDRICGWKKRGKSLLLCLPLTEPKERGGLNEWALMLRDPDTWAHTGSLFVAHACLGLPVFCGPMTMNLGSLSQVFSLDQMSLCRLSSHGFCRGTDRGIRDLSDYIHLMCTDTHIKNAPIHTYIQCMEDLLHRMNEVIVSRIKIIPSLVTTDICLDTRAPYI